MKIATHALINLSKHLTRGGYTLETISHFVLLVSNVNFCWCYTRFLSYFCIFSLHCDRCLLTRSLTFMSALCVRCPWQVALTLCIQLWNFAFSPLCHPEQLKLSWLAGLWACKNTVSSVQIRLLNEWSVRLMS